MAIKKVAILITIDSGEQEDSCYSARVDSLSKASHMQMQLPGADETYIVGIHNSSPHRVHNFMEAPNQSEMLDCAAHEIGHVLSGIFELPNGMLNDPRQKGELARLFSFPNAEQVKRIIESETVAWDLAQKVRPDLDRERAAKDLATYDPAKYDSERKLHALPAELTGLVEMIERVQGKLSAPAAKDEISSSDPTLWHTKGN